MFIDENVKYRVIEKPSHVLFKLCGLNYNLKGKVTLSVV